MEEKKYVIQGDPNIYMFYGLEASENKEED